MGVTLKLGVTGDYIPPFAFEWLNVAFIADWNEQDGCFVKAPTSGLDELKKLQEVLSR